MAKHTPDTRSAPDASIASPAAAAPETSETVPAAVTGNALARALIGSMPVETFDRDIRERRFHRFEEAFDANALAHVFSLARLEAVLAEEALPPYVDIYAEEHLKRLLDMQRKSGQTARDVALRCFREGQTIRVRDVERFDQTLGRLVASIEQTFAATAQANVYLTPPGRRGFPPHFDITDVFIVQVIGSKEWTIYADYTNRTKLPLPSVDWNPDRYQPLAVQETMTLQPGDVLYLPRGTMHAAACGMRESMHLTVSIVALTFADLLKRAADIAANSNVELRRRVPLSAEASDAGLEALARTARALILAELERVDMRPLLREKRTSLRAPHAPAAPEDGFESAIGALLEARRENGK